MGLLKKIKRTVRKAVPKELAGIMTAAAPFVAPYSLPAAAALTIGGQLKQTGRINPILTAGSLLPGIRFQGGAGPGAFKPTGITRFGQTPGGFSARDLFLRGYTDDAGIVREGIFGGIGESADKFLFGESGKDLSFGEERVVPGFGTDEVARFPATKGTRGLFGAEGKFNLGQSKLIRKGKVGDNKLDLTNIAALAASGLSLATASKQIEEEAKEEGASDSEIAALTAEAADFWSTLSSSDFAVTPTLAQGGRVGFAEGTDKNIPNDPKSRDMASFAKLKDFVNPSNYFMNPRETDDFQTMQKERFMYDYKPKMPSKMLDKIKNLLDKDDRLEAGPSWFFKRVENLEYLGYSPEEAAIIAADDNAYFEIVGYPMAQGGLMRKNLALGTRPTAQESGLGGLPIEADMRYSGGFMPYGAKEKADDVPARLSKNEFVFTADAVRAAGGGSVQKGAQKMYNTMKQLEAMGRA